MTNDLTQGKPLPAILRPSVHRPAGLGDKGRRSSDGSGADDIRPSVYLLHETEVSGPSHEMVRLDIYPDKGEADVADPIRFLPSAVLRRSHQLDPGSAYDAAVLCAEDQKDTEIVVSMQIPAALSDIAVSGQIPHPCPADQTPPGFGRYPDIISLRSVRRRCTGTVL